VKSFAGGNAPDFDILILIAVIVLIMVTTMESLVYVTRRSRMSKAREIIGWHTQGAPIRLPSSNSKAFGLANNFHEV
jgi:hypothetical protein